MARLLVLKVVDGKSKIDTYDDAQYNDFRAYVGDECFRLEQPIKLSERNGYFATLRSNIEDVEMIKRTLLA